MTRLVKAVGKRLIVPGPHHTLTSFRTPVTGTTAGPTIPVGPQSITQPAGSITIAAGASIQTAINANAAGATFWLLAGTYSGQTITPKTGNTFVGQLGAIIDGGNSTTIRFLTSGASITLQNLKVQNYKIGQVAGTLNGAGGQDGPISFTGTGSNWLILQCEITGCVEGPLVPPGSTVRGCFIHDNQQSGGGGAVNNGAGPYTWDSNEVSFNNTGNAFAVDYECGGLKVFESDSTTYTHNYVHDNHGPGLWQDTNCTNCVYSWNIVQNNAAGIEHEISYDALIHDNICQNNGIVGFGQGSGFLWASNIQIAGSRGVGGVAGAGLVEVYNNTIGPCNASTTNNNCLGLIQQDRTDVQTHGAHILDNVSIHDNTVDLSAGGGYGAASDYAAGNVIFTNGTIHWNFNHYTLGTHTNPFWWNGSSALTVAQWKGFGFDLNGTFN